MKKIIYIVMFAAVMFASCDKFVDIQPKGLVIPKSLNDLRLFLNNSSLGYYDNAALFMDDDLKLSPADVSYFAGGWQKSPAYIYTFENYFTALSTDDDRIYNEPYSIIGNANFVLQELEKIGADEGQATYNQIKGEALVHRAHAYFMAATQYCKQYDQASADEAESGLPILLAADYGNTTVDLTRSTLQEVYDLVIADLTEAASLLENTPNTEQHQYIPKKVAALGLLAKVYLQMGDMTKAADFAGQALAIKSDLLDYRNDDNIGSMEFDWWTGGTVFVPGLPNDDTHPEILLEKSASIPSRYDYSTYSFVYMTYLSDELVALFDHTNDIRYAKLVDPTNNAYKAFNNGYYGQTGGTVPEMYLIRAEANARLGNVDLAKQDIITLLTYRYLDGTVPDFAEITTTDDAIDMVMQERRKELMFQGHRYRDIKRLNALYNANISLSHVDGTGNVLTLSADSPKWVWAIPRKVVTKNPEINQNPR